VIKINNNFNSTFLYLCWI